MRYALATLLVCILPGFQSPATAQQQIFKNYTVNDGLISNSIRRVFQDSKGFLWIATWEGLSKYDGHTFTSYSTANGLSHNLVNDFCEAADGRLFVALNNGSINTIHHNTVNNITRQPIVVNRFICASPHPILVVTDDLGIRKFSRDSIQPGKILDATYLDLQWLSDSTFIAITEEGIRVFNHRYELVTESTKENGGYVATKVFQDSKKRIWIGTTTGLKLVSGIPVKNNPITFAALPAPFNITVLQQRKINDIFEENDGTLWVGTATGLVKINPDGSHQLVTVKDGLGSNIVTSIFQDKEKNIWFGTVVGLSKLVTRTGIKLYPIENGVYSSDNSFILHPVDSNNLLVSTYHNVQLFNKLTGKFIRVGNVNQDTYYNVVSNTYPPVYMGYRQMASFNAAKAQFNPAKKLPFFPSMRIVADRMGNHFFSNQEELFSYVGNKRQRILDDRISGLLVGKNGDLWAATWQNGLYRIKYRMEADSLRVISRDQVLPGENIRTLFEDRNQQIWAGTRYQGVYRLIHKPDDSYKITHYNQSDGLSSNFIRGIREDGNGNIWIAFYQGLDKLIPSATGFRVFNFSRVNNYFASMIGIEMMDDHSLWVATNEGLTHIIDGQFENLPPLPTYITSISSADSMYQPGTGIIHLHHRQNQVQFEFSSPGFINEKQLMYSYRLSGHSVTGWTKASNQHIVSYASLNPGKYIFEVRSLGWNGQWGKSSAVQFIIAPPFWQSWLFAGICVVTAGLIIFSAIRKRISAIRHEAEMKQKIAETEMMALRAQMNPHFIFNCLNSIDNLIQVDEKEKATAYLSKFARLIRAILENSTNNLVPCWKDMETLQLYLELEALRFDKKFIYKINVDPALLSGDYKVPPLIIQPFVENAIHHGLLNKVDADRKLQVDVTVSNNQIIYQIEDNGVGRVQSAAYKQLNKPSYKSMGILISSDRINLHNGKTNQSVTITDLYDPLAQPAGTRVVVSLFNQP